MIPKYTGYLPRKKTNLISHDLFPLFFSSLENKYRIGQTYGDTSRELPVCSHSFSNYGDFLRAKTSMEFTSKDAY